MVLPTKSLDPVWGVNFDIGYVGFTYHIDCFLSIGIAYFERWERMSDIPVSHTFIVSGPDSTIEALSHGVVESDLNKYFRDPKCLTFFRVPRFWSKAMGASIVSAAADHLGDSYGYPLLFADLLANCMMGRFLNWMFHNNPNRTVCDWLDVRKSEICSELVAKSLRVQPGLSTLGCLSEPPEIITPQRLFEDSTVFQPWNRETD